MAKRLPCTARSAGTGISRYRRAAVGPRAHGCRLKRNVGAHETVRWDDIEFDSANALQQRAIEFRRAMETHLPDRAPSIPTGEGLPSFIF